MEYCGQCGAKSLSVTFYDCPNCNSAGGEFDHDRGQWIDCPHCEGDGGYWRCSPCYRADRNLQSLASNQKRFAIVRESYLDECEGI